MTIGILGKKLGMTQIFQEDGTLVPCTVLLAGPCTVMAVKAKEAAELPDEDRRAVTNRGRRHGKVERPRRDDGYYAVQLGFEDKPERKANAAEKGHAARSGGRVKRVVREFRLDALPPYKPGDEIKVDLFKDIPRVDIVGSVKGRGFTGTIKRWGFARQRTTHGNSKAHRKLGGIGRTYSTMKGVPKGKKMPGHHGAFPKTVQNLEVVRIDEERNLLFVRGPVPGTRNGYVVVRKSTKVVKG